MNVAAILKTAALVGTALGIGTMVSSCKKQEGPVTPTPTQIIDVQDPHLISIYDSLDEEGRQAFEAWYSANVPYFMQPGYNGGLPDNFQEILAKFNELCAQWVEDWINNHPGSGGKTGFIG